MDVPTSRPGASARPGAILGTVARQGAVVVGAGPNGLAAAVTLARAGVPVRVLERMDTIGGGARTAEVTLPGFRHDLCSAVHPMADNSAFFTRFGLRDRVDFVDPEVPYAHGLTADRAVLAWRDLDRTADGLGTDGKAFRSLLRPLVQHPDLMRRLVSDTPLHIPPAPLHLLRIGLSVLDQGSRLWNRRWETAEAPALLTGAMAHPIQPMPGLGWAACFSRPPRTWAGGRSRSGGANRSSTHWPRTPVLTAPKSSPVTR